MKCVKIMMDDNGGFSVGECPPEEAGGDYMQPAESIDAAMMQAKTMLTQTAEGMEEQSEQQAGFDSIMGGAA